MSQENVETVRSSMDGWNRGDVDAWLRVLEFDGGLARKVRAYHDRQQALEAVRLSE